MSTTLDKTIARAEGFLKRFRDKPVNFRLVMRSDGSGPGEGGQSFGEIQVVNLLRCVVELSVLLHRERGVPQSL